MTPVTTDDPNARSHDADGQFQRTIEGVEFDRQCAELKAAGKSYRQIGLQLGVSQTTAMRAHKRAMADAALDPATREEWIARSVDDNLERAQRMWEILNTDHPMVQFGKIIPGVNDLGPKFMAERALARIDKALRELIGADAPTQHVVTITDEQMNQIQMLERELQINDAKAIEAPVQIGTNPSTE